MYDIGRLCMKIAGRDAGKYCLVVDRKDERVLIDGQTRRREVNPAHLEPTSKKLDIKKGASTADVKKALATIDIEVEEPVKRPSKPAKEE